MMANTWQWEFPWQNILQDRYEGTAPVMSFPPNGYGLFDMAGNVWEWTSDFYTPRHPDEVADACCGPPSNPRVSSPDQSYNVGQPGERFPRHVVKGGSHLCAPNHCLRYRPAARQAQWSRHRWHTSALAASSVPARNDVREETAGRVIICLAAGRGRFMPH